MTLDNLTCKYLILVDETFLSHSILFFSCSFLPLLVFDKSSNFFNFIEKKKYPLVL